MTCEHHCVKYISWSAVITGGLVGLGLSFLLNLFAIGIGLTAFSTAQDGVTALAIGGFLGFLIGGLVSMFAAGWVAGYMGRPYAANPNAGALYGFGAWVVALILGILLAAPSAHFLASTTAHVTNNNAMVVRYADTTYGPRDRDTTTIDSDKAAADMAKTAFALFVLFFLGAVASCIGGYYGMLYNRDVDMTTDVPRTRPRV